MNPVRTLTLNFNLHLVDDLDCDRLAELLQYDMTNWQEGRHPFAVEMMQEGIRLCVNRAISNLLDEQMQAKYGHEMITSHGGRGRTAKWHIESCKAYKKFKKPWLHPEVRVEIT